MSPSNLFTQLLKMASRTIFDPASCFPAHPLLPKQPSHTKTSPARKISEYLEIVPIQGKGFGTIATKDISAYTLLFTDSPAGTAPCQPLESAPITQATRLMPPLIKARFDALHEGARPFETREMRIWKTNAFLFDPVKDRNSLSAIFLDLSRINHSCLPNAEYHANFQKERMELFSIKRIAKGEEVTICYGLDFKYRTGEERNAHLRYVYGFSCQCGACADPGFREVSDRRRRALKVDWYCGMKGMRVAPDFSAKALGIEGPSSARPIRAQEMYVGFQGGMDIWRPGTVELLRRAEKLMFDEGFAGEALLGTVVQYAVAGLCNMHKRMKDQGTRAAAYPMADVGRCVQLLAASEVLMRRLRGEQDAEVKELRQLKNNMFQMWNVSIAEEMTVASSQEIIAEILSKEPDPFVKNAAYTR